MIKTRFCSVALCCALSATQVVAQSEQGNEMERARCGDIIDLFVSADPEVNKEDEKALAVAQDQTYVFLMWAHGFMSGRDGIDFKRRPLNQQGITALVGEIYTVCKDNEDRLFLDAVKEIR